MVIAYNIPLNCSKYVVILRPIVHLHLLKNSDYPPSNHHVLANFNHRGVPIIQVITQLSCQLTSTDDLAEKTLIITFSASEGDN